MRQSEVLHLRCPTCQKRLRVNRELAGKRVSCPNQTCRSPIHVPEATTVDQVVDEPCVSSTQQAAKPTNTTERSATDKSKWWWPFSPHSKMSYKMMRLVNTVLTNRIVGYGDESANWKWASKEAQRDARNTPRYNTPERLAAADELAKARVTEALPALEKFFVEGLLNINLLYDEDREGYHHFTYPSEMRRLGKSLLRLGGNAAFHKMMITKVLPALEMEMIKGRRHYSQDHLIEKRTEKLGFIRKEFGSVSDWEREQHFAEARRVAQRAIDVQEERKSERKCLMCGNPLGFFDRLRRREKHPGCYAFVE